MIQRWMHLVFSLVWLSAALSFGFLAFDAQRAEDITLPRFQTPAPAKEDIQIGSLRFQDAIDGIADAHDRSVAELEHSIRETATFRFRLDLLSCFVSIVALVTQAGQFLHVQSEYARRMRYARQHP
jgi:hypothetical protein